jgi:uncharacterized protein YkwD
MGGQRTSVQRKTKNTRAFAALVSCIALVAITGQQKVCAQSATLTEPAENTASVTFFSPVSGRSSTNLVVTAPSAQGSGAFGMTTGFSTGQGERVTLNATVRPNSSTKVFFESLVGYSMSGQVPRLEVSTNNGSTWAIAWTNATADAFQGAFTRREIPLAPWAGQDIRLRWHYVYTGGSGYTSVQNNPPVGWFIDDIQIGESFATRPYSVGEPTGDEVASVWFINRARTNANAEALRLASTTEPGVVSARNYFVVNTNMMISQFAALPQVLPPLAINPKLTAAARLHVQDMFRGAFQGHDSSTNPYAPNQPGDAAWTRLTRQGYTYSTMSENVFCYGQNPWMAHAGFNIDWGVGPGGMQTPAGHRLAIHGADFKEIGVGCLRGTNKTVGPFLVSQSFGTSATPSPMVVGTAWRDANTNGVYDAGEGRSGIAITAAGASFHTASSGQGAYALPLPGNGTFTVTYRPPEGGQVTRTVTVTNGENILADLTNSPVRITSLRGQAGNQVSMGISSPTLTGVRIWAHTNALATSGWTDITGLCTISGSGPSYQITTPPSSERARFFKVVQSIP